MSKKLKSKKQSLLTRYLDSWRKSDREGKIRFVVIAVAIVVGFFFIAYNAVAYYQQRQYEHAIADLDELHQEIAAEVGPADQVKSTQYCDYVSETYGQGPRYCVISTDMLYGGISRAKAQKISEGIKQVIIMSNISDYQLDANFGSFEISRSGLVVPKFNLPSLKNCLADMIYRDSDETQPANDNSNNSYGLAVSLTCQGGNLKEFFPERQ